MDYNELQALAKHYGIKYHRVGRKDLEKLVKAHEAKNNIPSSFPDKEPEAPPVEEQPQIPPPADPTPPVDEKKEVIDQPIIPSAAMPAAEKMEGDNLAIVKNKAGQEIRRYSLEVHGTDFTTLAKSFAAKNKYTVTFLAEKPGVYCKSCGAKQ
jgi:hypothetical protein